MVQEQRAYEAAAPMLTTVDEMLDVLINRTGLVDRRIGSRRHHRQADDVRHHGRQRASPVRSADLLGQGPPARLQTIRPMPSPPSTAPDAGPAAGASASADTLDAVAG